MESLYVLTGRTYLVVMSSDYHFLFLVIIFRVAAVDRPLTGLSWGEILDKILDHSYIGVCVCVLRTSASETK